MKMKKAKRIVRRGRRIYGAVFELSDGREVYLARRRQAEVFRSGEKTNSDAFAAGKAAWALDDETLLNLRMEGIAICGVFVKETGDIYLTDTANYFDKAKAKVMNYEARGGALQRYLPTTHFRVLLGSARVK